MDIYGHSCSLSNMNDHEYPRMAIKYFIYDYSWTFMGIRVLFNMTS